MVAVVNPSEYLSNAFHYNEKKVDAGKAVCLLAENYPREAMEMTKGQRYIRLKNRNDLNPRTQVNTLHITLNFHPDEKEKLENDDLLRTIVRDYMERLGYSDQPFLVYKHNDAGHPHLHIVTTCIDEKGHNKGLHNIHLVSETARKAVEETYKLIKAQDQPKQDYRPDPVNPSVAQYGKVATRTAINNVLVNVLKSYSYTSLGELNALLRQYNISADRGLPGSRMYQHKGLSYQVLDDQGKPISKPLKASLFTYRPTLSFLQKRFQINRRNREVPAATLRKDIDLLLLKVPENGLPFFLDGLRKKGIDTCILENADGRSYGITYIDHRSKTVFKGSSLGPEYGINAILKRCHQSVATTKQGKTKPDKRPENVPVSVPVSSTKHPQPRGDPSTGSIEEHTDGISRDTLMDILLRHESVYEHVAYGFRKKKKKKKKSATN